MHETESPAPANVVLTREDAHFLAVRLRRLCAHLNYSLPKFSDDDASLINIAGTVVGALLTNLTHGVNPPEGRPYWCAEHRYAAGEPCPNCGQRGHVPPRPLPAGVDACEAPSVALVNLSAFLVRVLPAEHWRRAEPLLRELGADNSATVQQINPPDAGPMPSICEGMEKPDLWAYAHLCGWRAAGVAPSRPFDDDWAPNPNDDQGSAGVKEADRG